MLGGVIMIRLLTCVIGILAAVPCVSLAGVPDSTQLCIDTQSTIEGKLGCIPGVEFSEVAGDPSLEAGIKQFEIQFVQPVDHGDAGLGTFKQKLVLLHRADAEPMVLQTSGYSIFGVRETAIMRRFGTNQIQIEHRFFSGSTPVVKYWSKLNIKQSADDFHRITVEFKKIYKKTWVGTGASKGGMTSVYHRYFYPNDLTGTVADVAPLSFSTNDERYIDFVENAGGAAYQACRTRFKQFQRRLLEHRDEIVPTIDGSFEQLGSADIAFEHAVIESHFIFWQYSNPQDSSVGCSQIPENGTASEMVQYLDKVNNISGYTDNDLQGFLSYFYQAATQLGNPANVTSHLQDLRRFDFTIDQYTPKGVQYSYSNEDMLLVKDWVKNEAAHIMFVYGEFDPWSAGAFPQGRDVNDMHHFIVKGGNHGSKFTLLDSSHRAQAEAVLKVWLNKSPVDAIVPFMAGDATEDLEALEFRVRRARHL
jgi:PS-10 peptidase S37